MVLACFLDAPVLYTCWEHVLSASVLIVGWVHDPILSLCGEARYPRTLTV